MRSAVDMALLCHCRGILMILKGSWRLQRLGNTRLISRPLSNAYGQFQFLALTCAWKLRIGVNLRGLSRSRLLLGISAMFLELFFKTFKRMQNQNGNCKPTQDQIVTPHATGIFHKDIPLSKNKHTDHCGSLLETF